MSVPRPVVRAPDGGRPTDQPSAASGVVPVLEPDGRVARSERTRLVIIDALRSLHADGDLAPTATRIAERAGVSRRTVWQHFANSEALMVVAGQVDRARVREMTVPIPRDRSLGDRITLLVRQRARTFEAMAPGWRAARIWEPSSPQLQRNKKQMLRAARTELEQLFEHELGQLPSRERGPLIHAVHAVTLWSFWESLRVDLDLSVPRARSLVQGTVTMLFDESGFPS